jgi:uncharacterized UBP type Zn finger protein
MTNHPSYTAMPRSSLSDVDLDAIRRSCDEVTRAADRVAREREQLNFGARITNAVKRRTAIFASARRTVKAEAKGDSFAEKLKREMQKRSSSKRHKEQAERERARYTRKPRPATKGE